MNDFPPNNSSENVRPVLPKLDLAALAAAYPTKSSSSIDKMEFYPGVVTVKNISLAGIEMPIPYQILFHDHIQSRLEAYALN